MNQQSTQRPPKKRLYLTAADHGRRLSLEEFESADAREGFRYELIHGRLDVSPAPNFPHEDLLDWLRDELKAYAREHAEAINKVVGPARVFVPDIEEGVTAPEPDLACYHDFPLHLPKGTVNWRDISPLLVVEVVSPDNADKDLTRNVPLYLRVPTIREYWIVDPRESYECPTLTVYRRRGTRWQKVIQIEAGGTYTTRLLPDFSLVLDRRD
jgi:Uma2 family endonuclease